MISVKRAADAMSASLRREFKRIQSLLRSAPESVEVRHQVGLLVVAMRRDPERYGKQAVALVATALGRDEATLYRFAQVASRWTEADVAHWLARAKSKGHPLTWWHLVEASAVARKRERDDLVRRAIDEGLSVRAVSRLAARAGRSSRTMSRLVHEAETLARRVATLREGWEGLREASAGDASITFQALERARNAVADLVTQAERARTEIESIAVNATTDAPAATPPSEPAK